MTTRAGAELGPLAEHVRALRHHGAGLAAAADDVAAALHALVSGPSACMPPLPPHGARLHDLAADVGRVAAVAERTGEALAHADASAHALDGPATVPLRWGAGGWWALQRVDAARGVAVGLQRAGAPAPTSPVTPPGRPGLDFVARRRVPGPALRRAEGVVDAVASSPGLARVARVVGPVGWVVTGVSTVDAVQRRDTEVLVTNGLGVAAGLAMLASAPVVAGAGVVVAVGLVGWELRAPIAAAWQGLRGAAGRPGSRARPSRPPSGGGRPEPARRRAVSP